MSAFPTERSSLLRSAIGRTLSDVERMSATTVQDFVARGGIEHDYLAAVSGPLQLTFTGGVVHSLDTRPSQLSVVVDGEPLPDHWLMDRHTLADTPTPVWLRSLIGRTVRDVRIYFYSDDVDSDEARQAAVSYLFDDGTEMLYCIYLHGRMDGDQLVRQEDLIPTLIDRRISVLEAGD